MNAAYGRYNTDLKLFGLLDYPSQYTYMYVHSHIYMYVLILKCCFILKCTLIKLFFFANRFVPWQEVSVFSYGRVFFVKVRWRVVRRFVRFK